MPVMNEPIHAIKNLDQWAGLSLRDMVTLSRQRASGADWAVLVCILSRMNETLEPPRAWPRVATIATMTGRSEATVKRSIQRLGDWSIVRVHRTRTGNEYHKPFCMCVRCIRPKQGSRK